MEKPNTYKIPCKTIDKVLFVNCYNNDSIMEKFVGTINSLNLRSRPYPISLYKKKVISDFLVDSKDFLAGLDSDVRNERIDSEEREEILEEVYEKIVEIYPAYGLLNMLRSLNVMTFKKTHGLSAQTSTIELKDLYDSSAEVDTDDINEAELEAEITFDFNSKFNFSKLEKKLKKQVLGQNEAVDKVINTLKLHFTGLSEFSTMLFLGPTGVGKTYLAKLLGDAYSGNFFKIDCGSFSDKHDKASLLGSPPGYVGSNEKSFFAKKAEQSNRWVMLFDEVEKGNEKLHDCILNLLEEGTIIDSQNNVLDFSKSIIILTSNQGVSEIKTGRQIGFGKDVGQYSQQTDKIEESLKKAFKPEMLNRIDDIIYFNQLKEEDVRKIIAEELKEYPVKKSEDLLNYIMAGGYSLEYGARSIKRYIKQKVAPVLAECILDKKIPLDGAKKYTIEVIEGNLAVINVGEKGIKFKETLS